MVTVTIPRPTTDAEQKKEEENLDLPPYLKAMLDELTIRPPKKQEPVKKAPANPSRDPVNHPKYYTGGGIETIDFIEAKGLDFCLGNVVKYVARAGHKGDKLEDLKKARWYLDREIEKIERPD